MGGPVCISATRGGESSLDGVAASAAKQATKKGTGERTVLLWTSGSVASRDTGEHGETHDHAYHIHITHATCHMPHDDDDVVLQ